MDHFRRCQNDIFHICKYFLTVKSNEKKKKKKSNMFPFFISKNENIFQKFIFISTIKWTHNVLTCYNHLWNTYYCL